MAELEVYPGLVAAGGRRYTNASGRRYSPIMALALWSLARHIDPRGVGRVHLDDLKRAGLELWNKATYYRSLREAEDLGLLRHITRKRDGAVMVTCTGLAKVADILELPSVGARKIAIPLDSLSTAKKFKAALWSAFHVGRSRNTGCPITRAKLRSLCGMPESTQRTYEKTTVNDAGYRVTGVTPNAVVLAPQATVRELHAAQEHIHGGCFIDRHTGMLLVRVGNTYSSSLTARNRGRARKINRTLTNHRRGLVETAAGAAKRIFFPIHLDDAPQQNVRRAEQAARKGTAVDVPLAESTPRPGGMVVWSPVWDSWSLQHVAGVA